MPAHSEPRSGAHSGAHPRTHSSPATAFPASLRIIRPSVTLATTGTASARARGSLIRQHDVGGNRIEVKRVTNEISQRDDEIVGMYPTALDEFARGIRREPYLIFGTEQDDVRQRSLDGVA